MPPDVALAGTAAPNTRPQQAQDAALLAAALRRHAETTEHTLDALIGAPRGPQSRLTEAMRYAALGGGKRMRAFLVMEGAAIHGADPARAARVAASVEMLHAYSLVHDDLPAMDDDDLRRGKPSCHRAFDEATAILAGDALQTLAFEVLADPATHPDPAIRCALVTSLARASGLDGMAGGQMIDMDAEGRALTVDEVLNLQALKTGCLIRHAAVAGAILAGADTEALAGYGADLGTAFQIADDLLDAEGTAEEIGKTAGKDAASGKATLVSLLGIPAARARAEELSARAAARLAPYGAAADALRTLAFSMAARRS